MGDYETRHHQHCPSTQPGMMTEMTGLNYKDVGNLYGCRNWVEYGLNQQKMNWMGSSDQYQDIEKW